MDSPFERPARHRHLALAGATGLVGRALLALLIAEQPRAQIHLLLRRPAPEFEGCPGVQMHRVDFRALPALPTLDEAWCALGTTIAQAGSEEAFRSVDLEAVVAFARAAHAAGASCFGVVSALGADAGSRVFYNRVKGEMEQALRSIGFTSLVIARPSLLIGDRAALGQPPRAGEWLAIRLTRPLAPLIPRRLRPISAETVARGMLAAMRRDRPGVQILESARLHEAGH